MAFHVSMNGHCYNSHQQNSNQQNSNQHKPVYFGELLATTQEEIGCCAKLIISKLGIQQTSKIARRQYC